MLASCVVAEQLTPECLCSDPCSVCRIRADTLSLLCGRKLTLQERQRGGGERERERVRGSHALQNREGNRESVCVCVCV